MKLVIAILVLNMSISGFLHAQSSPEQKKIPFTLKQDGFVTLVIENKEGKRIKNLVTETWYTRGAHTILWDGTDDLARDVDGAHHGIYNIPKNFAVHGEYNVHGLVHEKVRTSYAFSVYSTGNPPWNTSDHQGGWLANHTPPQAAVFVPPSQSPTKEDAIFLGSYITEGPDGFIWTNLEGTKKGGKKWVGGSWTAAPFIACDKKESANSGTFVYVASVWETGKNSGIGELRVTAMSVKADKTVLKYVIGSFGLKGTDRANEIGGLAVYNGIGVTSLTKKNQLIFFDVKAGKVIATVSQNAPKGLAFDDTGKLYIISGKQLVKVTSIQDLSRPLSSEVLINSGLKSPTGITIGKEGSILVSDGGVSNQVKIFDAKGKLIREIGKAGISKAGIYDPLHMNNPAGITVDSKNQLWVAENDFLPKRVSVWSLDGKLIKAFYGPAKYGGGGTLDPKDPSKFYYADESRGTIEFKLDWKTGQSVPAKILYRKGPGDMDLAFRSAAPETPLYFNQNKYFTNCYNTNPTNGNNTAFLFQERNGIAYPAAAMGSADTWDVLKEDRFRTRLPADIDLKAKGEKSKAFFIWTDLNEDVQVQPEEVTFQKGTASGVTVMPDLSFCITQLNGNAVQFKPVSFSKSGVPVYAQDQGKVIVKDVLPPGSSGGNQILAASNGWTVVTQGIKPFDRYSLSGAKDGKPMWSYPNLWPGLHASHEAPIPEFSGELIGPTRLLGGLIEPKDSDAGPLWAINSNHGMVYIFTADGLFVTTLFQPMRTGKRWNMPVATRGMSLDSLTLGEENFWPTITQTKDGQIYLVDGARSSLVKVDGLGSIQRIPPIKITVTEKDQANNKSYLTKLETERQRGQGTGILEIPIIQTPVKVDGNMDDWSNAGWADIDKRGVKANFNSKSKPYNITAAIRISADRLYAAYRTADAKLLINSGEMTTAPFKTGGALDLMIGADPKADSKRTKPEEGDLRLLVTLIQGKPKAILYRAVLKGTKTNDQIPFSSPSRTITFDQVKDVTAQLEFAASKDGDYEFSVPLAILDLKPADGLMIKGDIGILRGDGSQTIARTYWNNKAAGIVSDVPSEAELTPGLWGSFKFITGK